MTTVLITGGTGSLGQELTKQLLLDPTIKKIIIYSRGEHKQESMMRKFKKDDPNEKLRFFIGDVRDYARLDRACHNVGLIIHTAALKIVPLMEANPFEAVKTNIIGTQNVIDCAISNFVRRVIVVSTDKAVSPMNLYGATKLCAEKMTLAANNIEGATGPKFAVVRYGNVFASKGSVVPLFASYKTKGEPFPITDLRMTRFFITLHDAAAFINKVSTFKELNPIVYIPPMKAFDVLDLVQAFDETEYKVVGIRPGEKIHELIDETTSSEFAEKMTPQELRGHIMAMGYM